MKTIWKFEIKLKDHIFIEVPKDAGILTVQNQGGRIQIWAVCDNEAEKEKRHFELYGTGDPIGDGVKKYIGTFQMQSGKLVFHLFERIEDLRRIIAMRGFVN